MVWQRKSVSRERIEKVKPDVHIKLGMADLPNKDTECPVKSEFQIDNK